MTTATGSLTGSKQKALEIRMGSDKQDQIWEELKSRGREKLTWLGNRGNRREGKSKTS